MNGRLRSGVIALSLLVTFYVLIGGVLGQTSQEGAYKQLAIFSEVLNRISSEYVEAPDMNRVGAGALHGLLESLDPYSAYFTPREYKEYVERGDAEADIGVVLTKNTYISVISTMPDSAAERAGLYTGDYLESIGGYTTREMSVQQAYILLEGDVGTAVTISVIKPGSTDATEMELVRTRRREPKILTAVLETGVGYAKLAGFPRGVSRELRTELKKLADKGGRGLVLDLRGTASGDMPEGIAVAGLFLDQGVITYVAGQKYPRETFEAAPETTAWSGPVAVLIDRGSAGPSEIVASALLDNRRAEVLGVRSYGKGSVQELIPLEDGAALLLSVAKYYRPAGQTLQDNAVMPSIPVPPANPFERPTALRHALPAPGDRVVNRAVEWLRKQLPS